MGLGFKSGDTSIAKEFILTIVDPSCVLSTREACEASGTCLYAIEDGMLRMYNLVNGSTSRKNFQERVQNYYHNLRFKHRASQTIVVSFDDPENVPSSKSMEQKNRDSLAFTDKEIEAWEGQHYFSSMTAHVESTLMIEFHAKDKAKAMKEKEKDKSLPYHFKTPFKWYVKRLLATRRFKPDIKMAFIADFLKAHTEFVNSPAIRRRDSAGRTLDQRILVDGVPWPFQHPEVMEWCADKGVTWDSTDTAYTPTLVDGSEFCPVGKPVRIDPEIIGDHYHGSMIVKNTSSCTLSIGNAGCFWLPDPWRFVEGEADTKFADCIRRCVEKDIRTRDHPPAHLVPTGQADARVPDAEESLPCVWATACDTDMIVILLLLLDELYDGKAEKVDFRLYLDLTWATAKHQPYHNLPGFASIAAQDIQIKPFVKGYRSNIPVGCVQVWDMTLVWTRLKASLHKRLPGSRADRSVQAFVTMIFMAGTDFISPLGEMDLSDTSRAYFSGGYLALEKAVRGKKTDAAETRGVETPIADRDGACSIFACRGMVHVTEWPKYTTWGFEETYLLDFVHMVLSQKLRQSGRVLSVDDLLSDEYKAAQVAYATLLHKVDLSAKAHRSSNTKLHNAIYSFRYEPWKRNGVTAGDHQVIVERLITHVAAAKAKLDTARAALNAGIDKLVETAQPQTIRDTPREHVRSMHLGEKQLVAAYSKKRRADVMKRPLNGSKGTSTQYIKRPDKNSPKERFRARKITKDSMGVFARTSNHQMYYWTTGTRKHYVENATATDAASGLSLTGFVRTAENATNYADKVSQ